MPSADIIVPEITHTDTPVTVTAAFKNAPNSVSWYISKNNGSEVLLYQLLHRLVIENERTDKL